MHPSSFTFPQRSTNEQDAPLLDDPAQQQPTPTTASSLYSFPAYGVQPQPPYFQDYHPLQSAYNAPYPLELVAPTQQLPSELLEAGVASQATLHPTLDRRPSYQAPNELPSLLPSVSDGLQLDVDGAAAWQQEIGRAPPAGHETSFGALGLGFEQEHHHGQQQQYPPYPQQHYPPTLDYPAWAIQPPSKRRNSSRPASSSSGSQVASPIGSTHHPQWPLSPLTPADQAAQPQLHQRQWSGAFIPRSASLPHLHDYAQGYQAANYSYPSPYLAAGYASLQHSPNPSQHNLPLRASPLTDSQGSFSPYDQHPPPFHSPASSLAGKLALSSLSKIHTNTATQPRPPRPRPTPPPVDPNSPLVLLAQRNRQQYCTISSTSSTPASPHNNSGLKQPRAATTRKNLSEADAFCFVCRSLIGRVIMRGTEQQRNIEWHSGYECLKCVPPEERRDEDYEAVALSSNEVEGSAVYEATFSGALDRLEGLELEVVDERPPAGKALPAKKRKRLGAERELVACDVCTRDVARGELLKVGDDSPVDFYVELVCAVCTERYRRCTDCGGGGGPRLGVGRWRSKELFVDGRLTCKLSHVRVGNTAEANFDIWPVADLLAHAESEKMVTLCRELFISSTIATLAIPDLYECPEPLARTFQEVEKFAVDGWSCVEGYLREDVEQREHRRRYLALRWTSSTPRRKGSAVSAPNLDAEAQRIPSRLVWEDRTLTCYAIGELDLETGSCFVPLSMPKGTGDSYDAATALQQVMLRRMQADLDASNFERNSQGLAPYPDLNEVWSIQMYKKESRIMNRLETQRGFHSLAEYLTKYSHLPDVDPSHFPPHRATFLPSNEFLTGWRTYARRFGRGQDLTVKVGKTRRKSAQRGAAGVPRGGTAGEESGGEEE